MTFDKLAAIEKTWDERRKEEASVNRIRIYGCDGRKFKISITEVRP